MLPYAGRWSIEAQYIVVDVKSAMARFGLGSSPPPNSGNDVEYIAWFRFPVTWTYLDSPTADAALIPTKPQATQTPTGVMTLVSAAPAASAPAPAAIDTAVIAPGDGRSAAAAQWEMVIPKMARPPGADRWPIAFPFPRRDPPSPRHPSPSARKRRSGPCISRPRFFCRLHWRGPFLARFWRQIAGAVVAIVVLAWLLWGTSGSDSLPHNTPIWSHRYSSPPGRLLSLYEPSRSEADYSTEFSHGFLTRKGQV